MKTIIKTLIALVLLAGIIFTGVQVVEAASVVSKPDSLLPPSGEAMCLSYGGAWNGPSIYVGKCTYPPGSAGHAATGLCSDSQNMIEVVDIIYLPGQQGMRFSRRVAKPASGVIGPVGGSVYCENIPGPGYGKCGNEAGKTDDPVTVTTCHGASVLFAAGACTGKCTVGPKVLNTAKKGLSQLDGEVLGQAYVKVRNPGGGSYKICMPGEGTIYKWVSGAWVAQATSTVNGVSCAWSSGDGNYVLLADE